MPPRNKFVGNYFRGFKRAVIQGVGDAVTNMVIDSVTTGMNSVKRELADVFANSGKSSMRIVESTTPRTQKRNELGEKPRHTNIEGKKMLRTGAWSGRSGGKFRRGLKRKRFMKKKIVKKAVRGTNRTVEGSKIVNATDVVWIGHATFVTEQVMRQMWLTFMYEMLTRAGLITDGVSELEELTGLGNTYKLEVWYREDPYNSPTPKKDTYTFDGTPTLLEIVVWLLGAPRPWNSIAESREFQFTQFVITQEVAPNVFINHLCVNATDVKIQMFVKSSMKIQNRSKAVGTGDAPDDMDQVDNVPLYGKSYSGRGTTLYGKLVGKNTPIADLSVDQTWGTIIGSENLEGRREPPQPTDFVNVQYCGKAHIDPGYIKASVLTSYFKNTLNGMFRLCTPLANGSTGLVNQRYRSQGKFRVFALEKIIDVGASEPITVAFETNSEYSCRCYIRRKVAGVIKSFSKQVIT